MPENPSIVPAVQTDPRYVNPAEAAARFGCSPRTIRRYVTSGHLKAYRFGPRLLRIDVDELNDLMRRIPTTGDAA